MIDAVTEPDVSVVPPRGRFNPWHWVIALVGYTVLTLVTTLPLIFHLADRSIGPYAGGDDSWGVWNLWVFRQSVNAGHDPVFTHTIYALLPTVQAYVESPADAIIGWFLQLFLTPLATYNVLMLLSFVLSGLMTYLLAGEFVEDRVARFAAGFLYTFATYHFARAAGHLGLATMQWMPFCAWRIWALWRRPTVGNAILAGLGTALVALSYIYYLSYFLFLFIPMFFFGKLLTDRSWLTRAHNLRMGALALLVAAILSLPFLIDYVRTDPETREATRQAAQGSTDGLGADLLAFVLPSPANPLMGGKTAATYAQMATQFGPIENAVFLGFGSIFLGLTAFAFRRNRRHAAYFWLVFGVSGLLLSMGTNVRAGGHLLVSWPLYRFVFGWPLLESFRAPNRLIPVSLLAFAVLSAFSLNEWRMRATNRDAVIRMRTATVLLLAASFGSQILWAFPYPSGAIPMPALYKEIGTDPEDALLLDLPLAPGAASDMYYETVHHKRLVNGYISRPTQQLFSSVLNVPYAVQFDTQSPDTLLDLATRSGDIYPVDEFADAMRENGIKYIVLHTRGDYARYQSMYRSLHSLAGAPFYDNAAEGLTAWRIPLTPADPTRYHFALGTGWIAGMSGRNDAPERSIQQDGQVRITAPQAGTVSLLVTLNMVVAPRTVAVIVNGTTVKTVGVKDSVQVRVNDIPLRAGPNLVTFHVVEGCVSPHAVTPTNADVRCFGVAVQHLQLLTPSGFLDGPQIQPGTDTRIVYGSGWLQVPVQGAPDTVGVVGQDGQILITTPQPVMGTISFSAAAVLRPRTMEVQLNGTVIQTTAFPLGEVNVTVPIPLHKGVNLLEIHAVEGCYRPTIQDQPIPDGRCFGFYVKHVAVAAS